MNRLFAKRSTLRGSILDIPPPWFMGILNVTPDSFSDGNLYYSPSSALTRLEELHCEGAHIIDIGAEATGPNSRPLSADVERSRLAPLFAHPRTNMCLSVDTYKSEIASYVLERGAAIINDVSAARADKDMFNVVREHQSFLVMMYAKGTSLLPHVHDEEVHYRDIVADISEFLLRRVEAALNAGLHEEQIVLDPGLGKFISNNPEVSWELLRRIDELCVAVRPFPVLIGISRKGFLGGNLAERDELSQTLAVDAVAKGVTIVRTHNVALAKKHFENMR